MKWWYSFSKKKYYKKNTHIQELAVSISSHLILLTNVISICRFIDLWIDRISD